MSKVEHMGVSPSQVTSPTRGHSCPKQTTPEQMCEFCAECIRSEPLESKNLSGSEAVENEPKETSSAETSIPNNEKLQAFCGDVPDSSFTDHLVLLSEDMRKSTQTNKASCSQQNTSEQKHGTELMHNEQSEQKNQLCFPIVLDEPRATSLVDNATLQPVSEDVSKSSQTDGRQTLEFLSGSRCNELDGDCVHSEPLDQKHQLGSEIIQNEPAVSVATLPSGGFEENLQTISEDMTKVCPIEPLQSPPRDANNSCQAGENSCLKQSSSEQTLEFTAGISCHELSVVNNKLGSQLEQAELGESSAGELGAPHKLAVKSSIEQLKQPEVPITTPSTKHLQPFSDIMEKNYCLEQLETPPNYVENNSACLGHGGKSASKSLKENYTVRSLLGCDRVLRSRSGEKPIAPESSNNLAEVNSTGERKRKKPKKIRGKKIVADEYSRIRTHLRYLLNRINYEQSLIDAYSSEGWKGLSVEKLKPEKELQRATSEILRRKLKIRDLFQRLDLLCAGGFPKSLFDSEGQIDSEDIYCAKCGSKDLSTDNDIILCDGACDRGFHQYCLEPPLLKEDIPPDDEGWLCPGCDCKVDCIDLVNELQGTMLFITDNWEKVFPEAAAGHNRDPNFGRPLDDSDDNDYDPDDSATDEQDQGDESSSDGSSSDESDFTSTSDEVEAPADDKAYLGLSSEDSEDDEYNPDSPELDDKVTQESSSSGSDFTSDSEDLAAVLEDNRSSGNDEGATTVSPLGLSNGQRYKPGGNNESLNNELLSIIKPGQDAAAPVYGKRIVERLDYKKLYDETYGNVPYDSSDDESWSDDGGPRKRTKSTREGSSASPDGKAPVIRRQKSTKAAKESLNETENVPKRRGRPKLNSQDTNIPRAKSHEGSSTAGCQGKRHRSSYRKLGEDVTQKLYNSFKGNQYPNRTTKESLAKELGLTFSQVRKWFENTRWSFNHPSSTNAKLANSEKGTCTPQSNKKTVGRVSNCNGTENVESPKTGVDDPGCRSGDVKNSTQDCNSIKPTTRTSRKRDRDGKSGDQASDPSSKIEVIQCLVANSPNVEVQANGRTRRRRNSAV